ncbi:MAG TPA: ABC transporter permease [Actinomycetota bacterium]|nr:ABC transporter permease [Actinomycetota bacterium]
MNGRPLIDWGWIVDHLDDVGERFVEHLTLTVIAVVIGLAIALPLAVVAHRRPRLYGPLAGVSGFLYTIPSLALFAFLVPYTGLSTLTAEIGLVSYTLLILIRNIVSGLHAVDGDVKEAARGMGFSDRELLWKVEMPLALPAIVAGIRLATVSTIALVTVTALIGKGGFGYFIIQRGLRTQFLTATLLGAALSVGLALAADGLLLLAQKRATPWARPRAG